MLVKNKLFLTSVFAVCIASPAMAEGEVSTITNNSQCDNDTLGTYDGTANVEAIWTIDPRTCTAGQSYDSTTNTCITCTAGNYCPGGTFNVNSQTNGLNTCPNGYALSESGAGADTDCYRTCTTSDVAHSESVSGGYYYGDNNQCAATSCASGWHIKEGVNLANLFTDTNGGNYNILTTTRKSMIRGTNYAQIDNSGTFTERDSNLNAINKGQSFYGISGNNTWAVDYGNKGIVLGQARCSKQAGVIDYSYDNNNYILNQPVTSFSSLVDETGQEGAKYCYCNITGYKDTNGNIQNLYSDWLFEETGSDANWCANWCVTRCLAPLMTQNTPNERIFNVVLFDSVPTGLASCEANNIALKWYNDQTEVVPANSAAEQCTYNETITIPTNEPTKTGYTFGGWKLRTNN